MIIDFDYRVPITELYHLINDEFLKEYIKEKAAIGFGEKIMSKVELTETTKAEELIFTAHIHVLTQSQYEDVVTLLKSLCTNYEATAVVKNIILKL